MNSVLSGSPLCILSDSRTEAIRKALSENEEFCNCFKLIDEQLNKLLKVVPVESRSALCEIESAIGDIISISNKLTYKQGFQDGINLIKQAEAGSKSKYLVSEFESRRKDAYRQYKDSKTGNIYRILKVVNEYTDEAEADQDLARLRAGEITEYDIIRKRKRK